MEINYRSKEESNRLQRDAFLALSPTERFYAFLALSERMAKFPIHESVKKRRSEAFQIIIDVDAKSMEGKR